MEDRKASSRIESPEVRESCLKQPRPAKPSTCCSKWWNQRFRHQHVICRVLESMLFRALVIFLVVADTALIIAEIMLDYFKLHYKCEKPGEAHNHTREHIDLAMEIAHFASIGILVFFIVELIVKIYAFAEEFWNYRRKKMEYFDAIIVISSLVIDLYFLEKGKKVLGEELLVIFAVRLWRFVRIVSSVAEGIRHGEKKHKNRLNKQYLLTIHRLVDLLAHKTYYIADEQNRTSQVDIAAVLEHFRQIDTQCQSLMNELDGNHQFPSTVVVAAFLEKLNRLEGCDTYRVVSAMLGKRPEV